MKERPYFDNEQIDVRLEYSFVNCLSDYYINFDADNLDEEEARFPIISGHGRWFKSTPRNIARLQKLADSIALVHGEMQARIQTRSTD